MINLEQFRKLTLAQFSPDFEEQERLRHKKLFRMSLSDKKWDALSESKKEAKFEKFLKELEAEKEDRSYDEEWLGSFFDSSRDGVLKLTFGEYTGDQVVSLELANEVTVNPMFAFFADKPDPERDKILQANTCEIIGCLTLGSGLEKIQEKVKHPSSYFMHVKEGNGYSTFYIYENQLLTAYLIDKDGEVVLITLYDTALLLLNRIESKKYEIQECEEMKKEEPDAADEFQEEIEEHLAEIKELEALESNSFTDAIKCIFVTPQESEIINKSDNFEYIVPVYEEDEEEMPDRRPDWLIKMEDEEAEKLSGFFMNSDIVVLDDLQEKQYEVDSFEELVAFRDELMARPEIIKEIKKTERELVGKPKRYWGWQLKRAFYREVGETYLLEKADMPLDGNFREIFEIESDLHLHGFRQYVKLLLGIKTTMAHWEDVETIGDVIAKLKYLNKNKNEQDYEDVPADVNQLHMDQMKNDLDKQMAEMNKMMEDMMKDL